MASKKPAFQTHSIEVNALLRSEIAHLWPTITTNTALQKECAAVLPQLFTYCQVLQLESEQLIIAAPSAAFASKLKQQLPKLQVALQKGGWKIQSIRIKVQTHQILPTQSASKQCHFSDSARLAFSTLEKNLTPSKHNNDLLMALRTLLARHR